MFDLPSFTGEVRVDTNYVYDLNHPKDHTLVGSSELGRTGEVQVQQLGVGGDFHYDNVRGREAPVWTPDTIAEATKDWFTYLGRQ